jgi:hypothetical protein
MLVLLVLKLLKPKHPMADSPKLIFNIKGNNTMPWNQADTLGH